MKTIALLVLLAGPPATAASIDDLAWLAGGIVTFVQGAAFLPHPLWLWAPSLCILLAAVGWLGRGAALLLTLLLSCSLTPYGTGLPVLVLFSIAATLMLTGTGPDATRAVDEVRAQFAKTRHHQQSVLVALREAITTMLGNLDPEEMERQFGGTTRGAAGAESQARYWSLYRELFKSLAAPGETGFSVSGGGSAPIRLARSAQ